MMSLIDLTDAPIKERVIHTLLVRGWDAERLSQYHFEHDEGFWLDVISGMAKSKVDIDVIRGVER